MAFNVRSADGRQADAVFRERVHRGLDEDSILNAAEEAGFIEFVDDEEAAPAQQAQQPGMDYESQQRVMALRVAEILRTSLVRPLMKMQTLASGGTDAFSPSRKS